MQGQVLAGVRAALNLRKQDVRKLRQQLSLRHEQDEQQQHQQQQQKAQHEQQLQKMQSALDRATQGNERMRRELEDVFCLICHERHCVELILPCKHLCMCAACVPGWARGSLRPLTCPKCRRVVVQHYPVFVA